MNWERREAVAADSLEQIGCEAGIGLKRTVQILTLGNLEKQLSDRTQSESINVLDLPLAPEGRNSFGRDPVRMAERLNTEAVPSDNGVSGCVEVGWNRVGRTLSAACGALAKCDRHWHTLRSKVARRI